MNVTETNAAVNSVIDEERQKYAPVITGNDEKQKPTTEETLDDAVNRLAAMKPLDYDRIRKEEAKKLGVQSTTLDAAVKNARKNSDNENLPFVEVEPWPSPIEPEQLLSDISGTIRRFIICDAEVAHAAALWAALTWFVDNIHVAPMAIITAPEMRCGKSLLLAILGKLSKRAITASGISPAALFRTIEAWTPTLLIDEADASIRDNEELRGLLNSGHTRDSAYVIRVEGEKFTPTKFSTWGLKALAGIGHVQNTLMDRGIILELRRKLANEKTERLRYAAPMLFNDLRAKLARFAVDYADAVQQARPPLPESLNDRAADNWEPLLAIAQIAGGKWLQIATESALKISCIDLAKPSTGIELLTDIKRIFEKRDYENIFTSDLIEELCRDEERPWKTYVKGREMTPKHLAGKLREYKIGSCSVRVGENTGKGYKFEQFADAIKRYVPITPNSAVTKSHCNNINNLNDFSAVTQPINVTDKNEPNSLNLFTCDLVTGEILRTDAQIKNEALFDLGNEQVEVLL